MSDRALIFSDIHARPPYNGIPTGEDTKSLNAVLAYASDHRWKQAVLVGDFLDLDCISSHNTGKPKLVENKRLQLDYDHGNRLLDKIQRALPGAKLVYLEGNHEYRATRYAEAFPAMEGKVEVPSNLGLKARGIQWVPFWSEGKLHQIGNAHFGHGRGTSKYHSSKNLSDYGVCYFYGHTHDVQEMSMTRHGDDKTICAKSIGCLCRYDQPYMSGRPSKWQQAFSVLHWRKDGFFNDYTVKIFDNSFTSPEGDFYKGR